MPHTLWKNEASEIDKSVPELCFRRNLLLENQIFHLKEIQVAGMETHYTGLCEA